MEFHLSSAAAGHVKGAYVYLVYARVGRSATRRVCDSTRRYDRPILPIQ